MKVHQIMTRKVATCDRRDTLEHAASLLWQHDCGCLPVAGVDGTRHPSGMITDRDICMAALLTGKRLRELRVEDAMAREPATCRPDDLLEEAERKMESARVRRLPVVDEAGALIGIISMADLAIEAARRQFAPHSEIPISEVTSTLAGICKPAVDRGFMA